MTTPRRGAVLRWIGHILLGIAALFVLLLAADASYQGLAGAADRRNYPPPGE